MMSGYYPAGGGGAADGFGGHWIYGDGSDGALVCEDGETILPGNYTNVTIPEGVTVTVPFADPHVPVICCTGTWTINGTVDLSGVDAVGLTGGTDSSNGDANQFEGFRADAFADAPFQGGFGGDGAAGAATGGAVTRDIMRLNPLSLVGWQVPLAGNYPVKDYGLGGAGSGDNTNNGGGGGGPGKFFALFARHIVHGSNNLYLLQGGRGGDGGDDGAGDLGNGDCGSGGGGAGGWWVTVADDYVGEAGESGTGGAPGTPCGTGTSGTAGDTGRGIHYTN